ncbi:MAG TPA: YifB family Mg chelatase-like AAA ATPase [Gammaproteobacteria bacterium]
MALARVFSRARLGIDAPLVEVEVHLSGGLPAFNIVGLPEAAVKEARDRVRSAIITSQFEFPARRITVNLAPADLPKEGGGFDLPIAIGILAAGGQLPASALLNLELLGELALDGALRAVRGVLPAAVAANRARRALLVPNGNGPEAALVEGLEVFEADHLLAVAAHLQGGSLLTAQAAVAPEPLSVDVPDLAEVRGQSRARRALEIAAAGGHSLLFLGPPGTGKSMLAARLPGILPPLTDDEALEAAAIASVSGSGFNAANWRRRTFRAPHHTASGVALVGGGSQPRPGEISLAHHGVLFLDELPEFDRRVLEVLREPLETGHIVISRAARQAEFPARFQLIAAMNPCPCGYHGDPAGRCNCTADQIQRYRGRLSGPLLDRIDLHVEVPRLAGSALSRLPAGEPSARVRERVVAARNRQLQRAGRPNARLEGEALRRDAVLPDAAQRLLDEAAERFGLSARAHDRIRRVARTIADLAASETIAPAHVAEAVAYRLLDRTP